MRADEEYRARAEDKECIEFYGEVKGLIEEFRGGD